MPAVLSPAQIEEKRIALVLAAIEILESSGIDSLTLRYLADRAGVSRSTPYLYFKDKMELIDAVRVHGLQVLIEISTESIVGVDHYSELMRRLGSVYVDFGIEHPELYQLIFTSSESDDDISNELRKTIQQHRSLIMTPMKKAFEEGALLMSPERLDRVLWCAVHGLLALRHAGHLDGEEGFSQTRADLENILALGFLNEDYRNKAD